MITESEFLLIMPHAHQRVVDFLDPLNEAMAEGDIATPERVSAFVAQLAHESGEFRYMQELADGSAYDDRADLGNTRAEAVEISGRHGSSPGRWWKGHGPIQITGFDCHRDCSLALYGDERVLLENPMKLTRPTDGCRAAVWFWNSRNLSAWADKNTEDAFKAITRRINGGLNGWQERLRYWQRAKSVLGIA